MSHIYDCSILTGLLQELLGGVEVCVHLAGLDGDGQRAAARRQLLAPQRRVRPRAHLTRAWRDEEVK